MRDTILWWLQYPWLSKEPYKYAKVIRATQRVRPLTAAGRRGCSLHADHNDIYKSYVYTNHACRIQAAGPSKNIQMCF